MAGRMNVGVVVVCLVALIQISSSGATSYTVGGSTGWTIPSTSTLYSTWASQNTYKVGDDLVFNFVSGHTVTEVSKSDYDACSTTNPISNTASSPATIPLTTAGAHYFICTTSGHCNAGQKLSVTATAASTTTPSATSPSSSTTPAAEGPSTTTTTTSSPPPGDSSSSSAVAGAGVILPMMLVVAALL